MREWNNEQIHEVKSWKWKKKPAWKQNACIHIYYITTQKTHTLDNNKYGKKSHDTWCCKCCSGRSSSSNTFYIKSWCSHKYTTKTFYLAFDDKYIVTFFIASHRIASLNLTSLMYSTAFSSLFSVSQIETLNVFISNLLVIV